MLIIPMYHQVKSVLETITIEPVVLLFCIISSLSKISSEVAIMIITIVVIMITITMNICTISFTSDSHLKVLYLQKGCQVIIRWQRNDSWLHIVMTTGKSWVQRQCVFELDRLQRNPDQYSKTCLGRSGHKMLL